MTSLSARRAWIEMRKPVTMRRSTAVALRKESVDRNLELETGENVTATSLSARRAWIEIVEFHLFASSGVVALRKESVDRNFCVKLLLQLMKVALRKESVDRNCAVCLRL